MLDESPETRCVPHPLHPHVQREIYKNKFSSSPIPFIRRIIQMFCARFTRTSSRVLLRSSLRCGRWCSRASIPSASLRPELARRWLFFFPPSCILKVSARKGQLLLESNHGRKAMWTNLITISRVLSLEKMKKMVKMSKNASKNKSNDTNMFLSPTE